MMDAMKRPPTAGAAVPTVDSTAVDQAWQVLREAQNDASPTGRHLEALREKIRRLRAVPEPDPSDLAILARALLAAVPVDREGLM